MTSRRSFLASGALAAGAALTGCSASGAGAPRAVARGPGRPSAETLIAAANVPVLRAEMLPTSPLLIEEMTLLRNGGQWMVRVRASGVEGLAVVHGGILEQAWPIFVNRFPHRFVGTDARDLEATMEAVYSEPSGTRGRGGSASNYKWQGLAFWSCMAAAELAVLDLLGKATGLNVTEMIGAGRIREEIAVYRASSARNNSAEDEVEKFVGFVEEMGAKAIKHKLGARMAVSEFSEARDAAIVPLMRETFPDLTLYADANGSFSVEQGIEVAARLADYGYGFFEEPAPFDHYDETLAIAREAPLPISGGEQEASLRQFLWMIEHGALDIVQPDIMYFGGMTRAIRVANAARLAGLDATPHISGQGLGFLYAAVFASCVENAGPYHEYKGIDDDLPVSASGGLLQARNGTILVPNGPGFGAEIDPDWLARSQTITA
ncbi:MAG: mandelate racemase/muconate lactonizing enzyme family protein [Bacteroidota bacterium]